MWLFVLLLAATLVTKPPEEGELFDTNDPIEVLDWLVGRLTGRLGEAGAWDLAQEAVSQCLPGGPHPWSLSESPTDFATHLVYRATDIRRNEVRRKGFRVEPDPDDHGAVRSRFPDPETVAIAHTRHARLYDAAMASFRDSPKVTPVLERILRGEITTDDEHARHTGLSLEQVRNARARVQAFVLEWAEVEDSGELPRDPGVSAGVEP